MAELELTRSPNDRRLYALEGVGTLRLEGWSSRKATAAADGDGTWRIARRSMCGRRWRRPTRPAPSSASTSRGERCAGAGSCAGRGASWSCALVLFAAFVVRGLAEDAGAAAAGASAGT
jgi:hypothetical protein